MEREYVPRSTGGGGERGKAKESREDDMVKNGGVVIFWEMLALRRYQ
jgi:hypothetical protein